MSAYGRDNFTASRCDGVKLTIPGHGVYHLGAGLRLSPARDTRAFLASLRPEEKIQPRLGLDVDSISAVVSFGDLVQWKVGVRAVSLYRAFQPWRHLKMRTMGRVVVGPDGDAQKFVLFTAWPT